MAVEIPASVDLQILLSSSSLSLWVPRGCGLLITACPVVHSLSCIQTLSQSLTKTSLPKPLFYPGMGFWWVREISKKEPESRPT